MQRVYHLASRNQTTRHPVLKTPDFLPVELSNSTPYRSTLQNSFGMIFPMLASSMIWAAWKTSALYKVLSLCKYSQVHPTFPYSLNLLTWVTKPVSKIKHDNRPPIQSSFILMWLTSIAFTSGPIKWTHCSFPTCQLPSLSAAARTESILSASLSFPFRF